MKSCWSEVYLSEEMVNEFKAQGEIKFDATQMTANTGVVINNSLLGIYDMKKQVIRKLVNHSFSDMKPDENNRGLRLFYDHLWNNNISVLCVNAPAGTGKTSTAMAFANQKIFIEDRKEYDGLTIARPNVEVGRGHGFLPGNLEEKLDPLNASFFQWIERLNQIDREQLKAENILDMQPIAYIRGLDFQRRILVIDECQNLTKHEMKTILTRIGKGCKVILIGDSSENQIDNKMLNSKNNGLTHVIENWQGKYEWFGYVELTECLRGPVCKAAIKDL